MLAGHHQRAACLVDVRTRADAADRPRSRRRHRRAATTAPATYTRAQARLFDCPLADDGVLHGVYTLPGQLHWPIVARIKTISA